MANTASAAPMPSPSVQMTTAEWSGRDRIRRRANQRSWCTAGWLRLLATLAGNEPRVAVERELPADVVAAEGEIVHDVHAVGACLDRQARPVSLDFADGRRLVVADVDPGREAVTGGGDDDGAGYDAAPERELDVVGAGGDGAGRGGPGGGRGRWSLRKGSGRAEDERGGEGGGAKQRGLLWRSTSECGQRLAPCH